jgi:DNA-binding Lrp family transcriptional regulator
VTTPSENSIFSEQERRVPIPDAVLIALYRQGASQRQAAEHLGISQAAVFKRWQNLRKKGLLNQDDTPVNPGVGTENLPPTDPPDTFTALHILEPRNGAASRVFPRTQADNPDERVVTVSTEPTVTALHQQPQTEIRAELEALGWKLTLSRGGPSLTDVHAWGRQILAIARRVGDNRE